MNRPLPLRVGVRVQLVGGVVVRVRRREGGWWWWWWRKERRRVVRRVSVIGAVDLKAMPLLHY